MCEVETTGAGETPGWPVAAAAPCSGTQTSTTEDAGVLNFIGTRLPSTKTAAGGVAECAGAWARLLLLLAVRGWKMGLSRSQGWASALLLLEARERRLGEEIAVSDWGTASRSTSLIASYSVTPNLTCLGGLLRLELLALLPAPAPRVSAAVPRADVGDGAAACS